MMGITGAFSSLGINERSNVSQESVSGKKIPKNCSLPNLVLCERPNFIRNVCDDEVETSEQPVDFSKKYCETKTMKNDRGCTFNNVVKSYNNSFTMYAETDLDQPTDYSLRYAEDDSDSDRCTKLPKSEATEFVQDTIKTYCTEDTPYETPFNFSTSTSMSDLRIDDKTPLNVKLDSESKVNNATVKEITSIDRTKVKSEFSSGLMSPEKPVNYCEEGTPGYFSRVASCGSLNSLPVNDPPKQDVTKDVGLESEKKELRRGGKFPNEAKAVKFEDVVNYAEETPLMFSRSSSLASLDSIEQHSIHDDRSSVVSDFSRLTSGIISPSELPDSPSQTVPPSPKPRKNPIVFPPILKKKTEEVSQVVQNAPESSVFEDVVKKFKMESTPVQFSTATSLSSLIDADDEIESKVKNENEVKNENLDLNNDLSENSDDEDILAACISMGMQSNRYSQAKSENGKQSTSFQFSQHLGFPNSEATLPKSDITSDSVRTYCTEDTPAVLSHAGSNSNLATLPLNENEKECLQNSSEQQRDVSINQNLESIHNGNEAAAHDLVEDNHSKDSRRSSFSCLSDDSNESDKALLESCILSGMTKKNLIATTNLPEKHPSDEPVESESSDDEDADILASCINIGMKTNRYTQSPKPVVDNKDATPDTVQCYCTEDTPAILSHVGSSSNLSILSVQGNEEDGVKDYFSDLNSNFSDEDDKELLEACIRSGMAAISGKLQDNKRAANSNFDKDDALEPVYKEKGMNHPPEIIATDENDAMSSLSDDSETEHTLLEQCIRAGMPKKSQPRKNDSNELTPAEKALLQQCILEGMKKYQITLKKPPEEESSELTEAEEALLRQCILSGMSKNKLTQRGLTSRDSTELTESERILLQQCILAGMPKGKNKRDVKKNVGKRGKELDRVGGEHTCCIHCPKNNINRLKQNGYVRNKRKLREREVGHVREGRDVSVLYVTSQILTLKKEVIDRSRDNWV